MSRLQRIEASRFLGREFLLWLWFESERNNSTFQLEKYGEIEIFLDDKIVLEPLYGEGNRHLLSGYDPSTSPEAAVALQRNKIPSEVKLKVVTGVKGWSFSVRGDDLQLRGLKIPDVLSQEDDDRLSERIYLLEEIEDIMTEVFSLFLKTRLNQWSETTHAIQQWIHDKSDE